MFPSSFWGKVHLGGPEECWPWTGTAWNHGYGRFADKAAHRLLFCHITGMEYDDERMVLHSCDNRKCCNPRHLRAGSHQDNMADMTERGRQAQGVSSARSKLTESDIHAIRLSVDSNYDTGRRFRTCPGNVWCIRNRKTWRHI